MFIIFFIIKIDIPIIQLNSIFDLMYQQLFIILIYMYLKIKAPEILTSSNLILNLKNLTNTIIDQVYTLQQFMKDYHKIYHKFAKDLQKNSQNFEKNIISEAIPINLAIMQFVKTMQNLARLIQKQSNKNIAYFKALKTDKSSQMFSTLVSRLSKAQTLISNYKKLSNQFRKEQIEYIQKASRFQNIQKDTVKYYSTEYYKYKFTKITIIEERLEIMIQKLKRQQTILQLEFKQIKKLIQQMFQFQFKKIKQMLKYSKQIIQKVISLDSVIAQENSHEEISVGPQTYRYEEQNFFNYTSEFLKKTKTKFDNGSQIRDNFYYYLKNIISLMEETQKQLVSLQKSDQFYKIQQEKRILQEYLGSNIYQEFTGGVKQVFSFCLLIQKLNNKFNREKRFQEIINHLKLNFQDFLKESIHTLEKFKKNQKEIKYKYNNDKTYLKQYKEGAYREIKKYFDKFIGIDETFTANFQQSVLSIINQIKNLFNSYQIQYPLNIKQTQNIHNQNQVSKIFTRKYFEVFIHPFIISQIEFKFEQSKFIEDYIKLNNVANNLDNFTLDLIQELPDEQNRVSGIGFQKYTVGCCGLTRINNDNTQNNIIGQYHCALINKILLQGKLYMLKNQIRFISEFNNNTFFGKTQIEIPKRDIFKIQEQSNVFKIIIVGTSHGQIKFTSFVNNPIVSMKKIYLQNKQKKQRNKNTQISYQKSLKTNETSIQYEIKEIKQRTIEILKKAGFSKLKTDLYTRSFVYASKQIKCELTIQTYASAVSIKVIYKSYENPSQIYSIKIIKNFNKTMRIHCIIEDKTTLTNPLMKQTFLQLAKKIVEPYQNNNIKEIQKSLVLKQCQSLILQISSIQSQKQLQLNQDFGQKQVFVTNRLKTEVEPYKQPLRSDRYLSPKDTISLKELREFKDEKSIKNLKEIKDQKSTNKNQQCKQRDDNECSSLKTKSQIKKGIKRYKHFEYIWILLSLVIFFFSLCF